MIGWTRLDYLVWKNLVAKGDTHNGRCAFCVFREEMAEISQNHDDDLYTDEGIRARWILEQLGLEIEMRERKRNRCLQNVANFFQFSKQSLYPPKKLAKFNVNNLPPSAAMLALNVHYITYLSAGRVLAPHRRVPSTALPRFPLRLPPSLFPYPTALTRTILKLPYLSHANAPPPSPLAL